MRRTDFLINKYVNKITELNHIIQYQKDMIQKYEYMLKEYNIKFENIKSEHKSFLEEYNKNVEEFEEKKDRYDCLICCNKLRDCVIEPCYHFVACIECSEKLVECPVCRSQIDSLLPVFGT